MKLNIEIRPIVVYLVVKGHTDQAVEIISRFLIKK